MAEKDTESPEQVGTISEEQSSSKEPTAQFGIVVEASSRSESNEEATRKINPKGTSQIADKSKNDSEQSCSFARESMDKLADCLESISSQPACRGESTDKHETTGNIEPKGPSQTSDTSKKDLKQSISFLRESMDKLAACIESISSQPACRAHSTDKHEQTGKIDPKGPSQARDTSKNDLEQSRFFLGESMDKLTACLESLSSQPACRAESTDKREQTRKIEPKDRSESIDTSKNDSEESCSYLSDSMENLKMASVEDSIATSAQPKRRIEKKFIDPTRNNLTEERECLGHFQEDVLGDGGLFLWTLGELASATRRVRHLAFSSVNWNQEWRVRFEWFRQSSTLTLVRLIFRLDTELESPTYFYFDLGLYNSKGEMIKHWSSEALLRRKSQEHRCQSISYDGENVASVGFDAGELLIKGNIRRGWDGTYEISEEL